MKSLWAKLLGRHPARPKGGNTRPREEPLEGGIESINVDEIADIVHQAQSGDCRQLMKLYRDMIATHSHLQACFSQRKEAITKQPLVLHPWCEENASDLKAAEYVATRFASLPGWQEACEHLLDSILYPVSLVEKQYRPAVRSGFVGYEIAALVPVPHQLLDLGSGEVRIRSVDANGAPTNESVLADPVHYIIHRGHRLSIPDHWGGPLRALIFWWLLSMTNREGWSRLLDRNGAPFLLGRHAGGDDEVRQSLERAMATADRLSGIVIPKESDLEIKESRASNGRVSQRGGAAPVFHAVANEEISKFLLGHNGRAGARAEATCVKQRADMQGLARTLRSQLFDQMLAFAGLEGRAPIPLWGGINHAENAAIASTLAAFKKGGLRVGAGALPVLSGRFGFPVERDVMPYAGGAQSPRMAPARI